MDDIYDRERVPIERTLGKPQTGFGVVASPQYDISWSTALAIGKDEMITITSEKKTCVSVAG